MVVLVIAPGQLKNLRSRYGSAGNNDDRYDAYVLADVVRTDRRRLTPLTRSIPATQALRSTVRARRDLVEHRVGIANQLRAHLHIVFPGLAGLFVGIDSAISLAFIERFPTQTKADWLTPARIGAWLGKVGYSGRTAPEVLHQPILAAPRGSTGPEAEAHAVVTLAYVAALRVLATQIAALEDSIADQLESIQTGRLHLAAPLRHAPSRPAARRDRRRPRPVPHADSLACLAGVAPSTRQSGKTKPSPSAGPPTANCATPCATSPATPATPTPGPPTSTNSPPAATTTPTPSASSAAQGEHHLALLARRHRLRSRPTQRPPTHPPPTHREDRLTGDGDTGQLMRPPRFPRAGFARSG